MNVVFMPHFGRCPNHFPLPMWRVEEMTELFRLFGVLHGLGEADGIEFGKTDFDHPQFYILGPGPEYPCIAFVSRITSDGRAWYVVQDGAGKIIADGPTLRAAIDLAVVQARAARQSVPYLRPVVGLLLFCKLATEQAIDELWVEVANTALADSLIQLVA